MNVVYLSVNPDLPGHDYWDHGLLSEYLFAQFECDYYDLHEVPEDVKDAVVVIPARNQADSIEEINEELAKLDWAIVILTGDEESVFPWRELVHPKMKVWVMSPRQGNHDDAEFRIGSGYREEAPKLLREIGLQEHTLDWFFAGQVTHDTREQCAAQLRVMPNGRLVETQGFGQGINYREYLENMARAKFVPCPSGPETPDNFRLFEALEAGCVPIADGGDYWSYLFGEELPFPVVSSWDKLSSLMPELLKDWPHNSNRVFAWWQGYKRRMADRLEDNILVLSGEKPQRVGDDTTIIIPTCPIPSAPSTEVIDEVITSTRQQLPNSEIIVMFDGIMPELTERKADYDEYTRRLLWKVKYEYGNAIPLFFEQHSHQSLMTREALKLVRTPLLFFLEHDTPLRGDIDWQGMAEVIKAGYANVIKLHHETRILPDHKYLMLDKTSTEILGVPLLRTKQWSQRPHLAATEFYRYIADTYFDDTPRFIEHILYGLLLQNDWGEFRVHIYAPEGNILRSTHLDGRNYVSRQ